MKVIKRKASEIKKEEAHGGSGSRKVYADKTITKNENFEAMTHGYLPAGKTFDWHSHEGLEEVMIVVEGKGYVEDEDGKYEYAPGDVFIFPANIKHKIQNSSDEEHEMIFVRVKR